MVYPLVIKNPAFKRDTFLLYLERKGIETRYLLPLINQPVYKFLHINQSQYPNALHVNKYGFYIGCHQYLTKADLDYIVQSFNEYCHNHSYL